MKLLLLLNLLMEIFFGGPLKTDMENYLKKQFKQYDRFDFEVVSSPSSQPEDKIVIDNERQFRLSGNMAYVPVKLSVKNGRTSQSVVSVRVKLYRKVLVAKHQIRYGTEINASDFDEKLTDVAQLRGSAFCDLLSISGSKAKNTIKEGDILTKESMQPLPILKSGDKVVAIYSNGNVEITMDAITRQEGCEGDIIRIVTLDKRLFRAKVIDASSVQIIE